MAPPVDEAIAPGDRGIAASALRPSGRARINGLVVDAIAERGYIDDESPVEAVAKRGFSWVVRVPREPQAPTASDASPESPDGTESA